MRPAFGTVLRNHRTTRGLTQEELADRSGLSVRAIRNLEIGRTERPQRQSVMLLATALRLEEPDHATLIAAAGRHRFDPSGYATPGPGRNALPLSAQTVYAQPAPPYPALAPDQTTHAALLDSPQPGRAIPPIPARAGYVAPLAPGQPGHPTAPASHPPNRDTPSDPAQAGWAPGLASHFAPAASTQPGLPAPPAQIGHAVPLTSDQPGDLPPVPADYAVPLIPLGFHAPPGAAHTSGNEPLAVRPPDPALADRAAPASSQSHAERRVGGRCELPPDVPELVGRDDTVATLIQVLTAPGPRLALVTGGPGVGRTATAVHVAYRVREWFPDGQVYADLDHPDGPLPVEAVLGRVLRSLGVTDLPAGRDERAALLRAGLAARRVLVVLDNVASEAQVRPLLTTGSSSAVVVTSRRALIALPGAHTVRLDPLTEDVAWCLLSRLVGDRVHAEPARAVIGACAGLPLALQVCGAWLAARPHRPVSDLAALLADDELMLDRLAVADLSVRASIAAHVAGLRPDERRLLHQLSQLDPAALCRLATADPVLRDGLDGLAQANLLDASYQMNALVKTYAREDGGQPRLRAAQ